VFCPELTEEDCKFLEKFEKVEFLVFNDSRLQSLKHLPYMQNIMKVEMCFNKIKGGLDAFKSFPNLRFLKLRGNRISDISEVARLSVVPLLSSLDLQ